MEEKKTIISLKEALEKSKRDPEFAEKLKKALHIPEHMKNMFYQFKSNTSTTADTEIKNTEDENQSKEA